MNNAALMMVNVPLFFLFLSSLRVREDCLPFFMTVIVVTVSVVVAVDSASIRLRKM